MKNILFVVMFTFLAGTSHASPAYSNFYDLSDFTLGKTVQSSCRRSQDNHPREVAACNLEPGFNTPHQVPVDLLDYIEVGLRFLLTHSSRNLLTLAIRREIRIVNHEPVSNERLILRT